MHLREADKKTVTKPAKNKRGTVRLTVETLEAHFRGQSEGDIVGLHAISEAGTCKWVGLDIDNHGAADSSANLKYAVYLHDKLVSMGFSPILSDSDGKGGFHLLTVFSEPIPSPSAHYFGKWLVSDFADHGIAQAPEVFPKQPDLSEVQFGNWMRLPGRHHTRDHWSKVWDGFGWRDGFEAVEMIRHTSGDPAELIPADAAPPAPKPRQTAPKYVADGPDNRVVRCRAYVEKLPPSVSGDRGHDKLLQVACETLRFGLDDSDALAVLHDYNRRADPEWDERDIDKKLKDAHRKVNGEFGSRLKEDRPQKTISKRQRAADLGEQDAGPNPTRMSDIERREFDPKDPLAIARQFRRDVYDHADGPTLYHDGDTAIAWEQTKYIEVRDAALRAELYPYLERAQKLIRRGETEMLVPFMPTQNNVSNISDALNAACYLERKAPCWLTDERDLPDPIEIVAASNGLIHLRKDATAKLFRPPTPLFFSRNALDYEFLADAASPATWLWLLDQLWPDDPQSIEALQEWFGYCLTPDTRQQKAMLLVGPKRAGKGTIARVLSRLIGLPNVCGPTLSGLSTNFGLWPLIGKLLAIISDARLSGRTDQAIITERILALTGEDAITIDRKNLAPVTERLLCRLMILTNELPRLADASGALASRFIVLTLTESFYGKEDTGLEERICAEMPGILLWAIEGWRRLRERGHFVQPATSAEAIEELNDLASPVGAFLREWCAVRAGAEVKVTELFEAWGFWCAEQGREQPGTQTVFGRDLRAAAPRIATPQRGTGADRYRVFQGITLTESAKATAQMERSKHAQTRGHMHCTHSEG
jgi:putative DNA primase/helicase